MMHWSPWNRLRALALGVLALGIAGTTIVQAVGRDHGTRRVSLSLDSPRVVVLKADRMLYLFDGDRLVRRYAVDLGTNPLGPKRRDRDGRTPEGRFRVVTKKADSKYHRFIGIDYPDAITTVSGLSHGLISEGEAARIQRALAEGRCPDGTTALGGGIGLHGQRRGRDWTAGCIALENVHIEELFDVLRIGDPVELLP